MDVKAPRWDHKQETSKNDHNKKKTISRKVKGANTKPENYFEHQNPEVQRHHQGASHCGVLGRNLPKRASYNHKQSKH